MSARIAWATSKESISKEKASDPKKVGWVRRTTFLLSGHSTPGVTAVQFDVPLSGIMARSGDNSESWELVERRPSDMSPQTGTKSPPKPHSLLSYPHELLKQPCRWLFCGNKNTQGPISFMIAFKASYSPYSINYPASF